jgi:hypothetical protein
VSEAAGQIATASSSLATLAADLDGKATADHTPVVRPISTTSA